MCESGGSCAHSTRPSEQRCCTRASRSRTNTADAALCTARSSRQPVLAANASVVLSSALASPSHCESGGICAQHMRQAREIRRSRLPLAVHQAGFRAPCAPLDELSELCWSLVSVPWGWCRQFHRRSLALAANRSFGPPGCVLAARTLCPGSCACSGASATRGTTEGAVTRRQCWRSCRLWRAGKAGLVWAASLMTRDTVAHQLQRCRSHRVSRTTDKLPQQFSVARRMRCLQRAPPSVDGVSLGAVADHARGHCLLLPDRGFLRHRPPHDITLEQCQCRGDGVSWGLSSRAPRDCAVVLPRAEARRVLSLQE